MKYQIELDDDALHTVLHALTSRYSDCAEQHGLYLERVQRLTECDDELGALRHRDVAARWQRRMASVEAVIPQLPGWCALVWADFRAAGKEKAPDVAASDAITHNQEVNPK